MVDKEKTFTLKQIRKILKVPADVELFDIQLWTDYPLDTDDKLYRFTWKELER